jgi:hypothetical protein
VDGNVYMQPNINKDGDQQIMQDSYSFSMHNFEASDKPLILHEPNELHGYVSDHNLIIPLN